MSNESKRKLCIYLDKWRSAKIFPVLFQIIYILYKRCEIAFEFDFQWNEYRSLSSINNMQINRNNRLTVVTN